MKIITEMKSLGLHYHIQLSQGWQAPRKSRLPSRGRARSAAGPAQRRGWVRLRLPAGFISRAGFPPPVTERVPAGRGSAPPHAPPKGLRPSPAPLAAEMSLVQPPRCCCWPALYPLRCRPARRAPGVPSEGCCGAQPQGSCDRRGAAPPPPGPPRRALCQQRGEAGQRPKTSARLCLGIQEEKPSNPSRPGWTGLRAA